ncbi:MAG TPA: hypothetical protein VNI57_06140 [Candidatus Saccharimonadales bacterium]|nr:hypothetical protein [Candidatus Saccharimonadales bacterium]
MPESARLALVAAAVLIVNVPFGFWRGGVRKFSLPWFVAVHAPVPLVYLVRLAAGVSWSLTILPVLVGAFFTGQFLGSRLRGAGSR